MVFSPQMSQGAPADQSPAVQGIVIFGLCGVCLALVWVGLARVAYDLIFSGVLSNLLTKFLVLAIVYAFGVGLGVTGRSRFDHPLFGSLAQLCAIAFLLLLWLSYLGIVLRLDSREYSVLEYLAFLALLLVELLALGGMRLITSGRRPAPYFALSLLVIVLFQVLLIVYRYVFASTPMSVFLVGDLVLLFAMAVASSAMLGEDAFRAFVERFIEKVG